MGQLIGEIFEQYSRYTGTGVFMVLFFVGLVFLAVTENDKEKAGYTVLLHGSVWMALIIFIPLLYVVYTRLVDAGTYWRFFWLIPMGIGLAYVGTELINDHRVMGFLLIVLVLLLGGLLNVCLAVRAGILNLRIAAIGSLILAVICIGGVCYMVML